MIVEFQENYLRELYEKGTATDKKHRYQPEVIKAYAKCIFRMQESSDLNDLKRFQALNLEMLKGDKEGRYSVRVNVKYRVEFSVIYIDTEPVTTICNIMDLSNHYQ